MEINIERSPQHRCPSEGSNSELFAHENNTLTARPQKFNQTTSNIITINMSNDNKTINNNAENIGMVTYMKETCQKMQPVKNDVVCELTFLLFCKYFELACTICFTIG